MNLHEFYEGVNLWSEDDLYACLAHIDSQTEILYPEFYHEVNNHPEDASYINRLNDCLETYELMSSIINRELKNR